MKIIALSDTHTLHWELPEPPKGDILISAGDWTGKGSPVAIEDFANWINRYVSKYKAVILIAGNHDFGMQNNKEEMLKFFHPNIHYLDHEAKIIKGIKVFGSPYTPKFYEWAFMKPDEILAGLWQSIPDDTELLITHGPPYTILDKNVRGEHCGSKSLYQTIKDLPKLKCHIFGHIHEARGHLTIDDVSFYNVSSLDDRYIVRDNPYTIIEYK